MSNACGCPGSMIRTTIKDDQKETSGNVSSQLRQWPVQMHLVTPEAPYFQGADVVLAADCVAYALGNFHQDYLKGHAVGIACPKLDGQQDIYRQKIIGWIEHAKINTLTVMIMQVPCCQGLLNLARDAAEACARKVPVKSVIVGIDGSILREDWL